MKNLIIFLVAASFGGFFMPGHAQTTLKHGTFPLHCTNAENGIMELVAIASNRYGEVPMIVAEMGPGLLILTHNHNDQNPSWSVIITKPGEACFFASGTTLTEIPQELTHKPDGKNNDEVKL